MRDRKTNTSAATPWRIYESARLSMQGLGLPALLQRLGKDVRSSLYLIVPDTLAAWQPGLPGLPRVGRRAAQPPSRAGGAAANGPSPSARGRRSAQHRHSFRPELPADSPGRAAAGLQSPAPPDGGARHRDRTAARRSERHLRLGSELLDDLLQRRLYREQAEERLEELLPGSISTMQSFPWQVPGLATDPIGLFGATTHACWFARRARKSFCCTRPASPRHCRKPWTARWA